MGVIIPQVITNRSGAQIIDGSLKFDSSKKNELTRTPSSAGNRRTWTWSAWVKRVKQGSDTILFAASNGTGSVSRGGFYFDNTNDLRFFSNPSGSSQTGSFNTNGLFRDTAWYHVVLQIDTTQSTDTDRIKIYVNGERQTPSSATYMAQNEEAAFNQAILHTIGSYQNLDYGDYHLTNVYFIDGQALGPESFGFTDPLTNTWKPKKYKVPLAVTQTVTPSYVSNNAVLDPTNAFDGSSGTEATYSGVGSWLSFTVSDASNLVVPFMIRNDSSGTGQTVAMFTDSGGSSAAGGSWGSTGNNNLSPSVSTTVEDTYTFPSTGTYYLRHTVGSDSNIFVYKIGGPVTTGANSFYLPMDGNSLIGQDQSGNGSDFTPVNFGGSVELDKSTGAKPILNTTQGGTQAAVGVFGSKQNVGYAVTVYNDGGGNKYYIDGVKQDTVTGLIRGATYTFDTSDSTVSSHPFRFSATSNGSHGGGSEYTNGVAAITGAATTITVPYNAPNTLYYYCTSHSGMGADITGITTNEKLADQYASNCTLAVPLVGNINDVSASIACTSTTKAMTNNGSAASSTNSNFYDGSWNFDASDDYLSTPDDDDAFNFGSDDFTMECWFYQTGQAAWNYLMGQYTSVDSSHTTFFAFNSNKLFCYFYGSSTLVLQDPGTLEANKWHHAAVSRSGNTFRLFIDGVIKDSGTLSGALTNSVAAFTIGADAQSNYHFQGQIQDARVYKGVAKYTSDFIPAAASPDILPDTPSGVSGSSKLTKITDGAVSFDGTGDRLTADIGSSGLSDDFCVEYWIYPDSVTSDRGHFQMSSTFGGLVQSTSSLMVSWGNSEGDTNMYVGNGSVTNIDDPNQSNVWKHYAVVRNSGTLKLYVNGKEAYSASNSVDMTSFRYVSISGYYNTNFPWKGFISNFRVVSGSPVYTKNFTPPTAPLTNITNTKLLTCQSNSKPGLAAVSPNLGGINNGNQWSSYLTASGNNINGEPADAFSGQTWSFADAANSGYTSDNTGNYISFDPPSGSLVGQVVKLYQRIRPSTVTVNGTSATITTSGDTRICTVDLGSSTSITNVTTTATTDGQTNAFGYLEVDGVRVKDPVSPRGDAAANTFNPFNTDIHTVRGQETGYATWNPLAISQTNPTLSDGNLSFTGGGSDPNKCLATTAMSSGKFYAEFTVVSGSINPGLATRDINLSGGFLGNNAYGWTYGSNGKKYHNDASAVGVAYGDTYTTGDAIGVAFDADNGILTFYKNGVSQGAAYTGLTSGPYFFATGGSNMSHRVNFGQKPFRFAPPDGFQPLNTANTRPVKVISRSDQFVGVTTWRGNGNTQTINNYNFSPDLVFIKAYAGAAEGSMFVYDTVRGPTKRLSPRNDTQEGTQTNGLTAFTDKGFSVGDNSSHNYNNDKYVAWSFKAGGSKGTFNVDGVSYASAAAAGLDSGTIAVTAASVGTKQGFSIIQFEGTGSSGTISHGLSEAPVLSIIKNRDADASWSTWTTAIDGSYDQMYLDVIDAKGDLSQSAPTSTVFTNTGTSGNGASGETYISYHWHNVPGLQKFGKCNGSIATAQPDFVDLGFKPALVIIKRTDNTGNWTFWDSVRNEHNPATKQLFTTSPSNESDIAADAIDILSNGFAIRSSSSFTNTGSQSYLFMAWAEAPSIDLFGGGANAR